MKRIGLGLAVLGLAACNGSDAPEQEGTFQEQELLELSVTDETLPYGVINAGEDVPEDDVPEDDVPEEEVAEDAEEESEDDAG